MNTNKRINQSLQNAKHINFDNEDKLILMSDCHRGDGSWSDDFANNQHLYFYAMSHYFDAGFTYIELGDGDELWENRTFCDISAEHSHVFWLLKKFFERKRIYFLYGNHDMVKKNKRWLVNNFYECYDERDNQNIKLFPDIVIYESIILHHKETNGEISLIHGHQADFFNDRLWKIGRFLIRILWRPLEIFGFNNPTGTAKNYKKRNKIENNLSKWSERNKKMLISGHTHRPVFPKPEGVHYFNDGSSVHPRCITAIEIENGTIALVKWSMLTRKSGTLAVFRDVLAGPEFLEKYFNE